MRFLDTTSLKFRDLSDREVSKLKKGYSILSHRWTHGDNEISYADVLSGNEDIQTKAGYKKLTGACALAKRLGYDLIWIDTCCINKTDSVELSEAINSMYRWYMLSDVCIAYLEDVPPIASSTAVRTAINASEWFHRGWTLQELIAPKKVHFYNRDWGSLGDKARLSDLLVSKTNVPADVLKNSVRPQACSVAQRMSWAAKRTTTRIEDRAYSLMGIFDVNMPMIYGEREGAFIRLQEQIISKSTDESIFAWHLDLLEDSTRDARDVSCGLLATSPACFARCDDVVGTGRSRGFRVNQFGLSISFPATIHTLGTYLAPLNATKTSLVKNKSAEYCAIILTKVPGEDLFLRTSTATGESLLMTKTRSIDTMHFNVSLEPGETTPKLYHGIWLRELGIHDAHITGSKVHKRRKTTDTDRLMLPDGEVGTAGIIRMTLKNADDTISYGWIKLGFDSASRPRCYLTFPPPDDSIDAHGARLLTESEKFLALPEESTDKMQHPIFNNDWTEVSNRMSSKSSAYDYDSSMAGGDQDAGFEFTFKAPLFEILVSVRRIPDVRPSSTVKGEVWTANIVAGKPPVYNQSSSSCCC